MEKDLEWYLEYYTNYCKEYETKRSNKELVAAYETSLYKLFKNKLLPEILEQLKEQNK